jgi:hypothetical protein
MLYHHCFLTFLKEKVMRKVQENQVGMKLNGTHQLLAYAGYLNLLERNTENMKKNKETLT